MMTLVFAAASAALLTFNDGSAVKTPEEWTARRRAEVAETILPVEYGPLPKQTAPIKSDRISIEARPMIFRGKLDVNCQRYRVTTEMDGRPVGFTLTVWGDPNGKNMPVLINGDGCWMYLNDETLTEAVSRGYLVASFNRCEFAHDDATEKPGVLMRWAWGYHRAVDMILQDPRVDPKRIAILGHSRGGKTAQLAGATDVRIAAVGDNSSGCGGSAPFKNPPKGAETIADITHYFPSWFAEGWRSWKDRAEELPFDQHYLMALMAPRRLFVRHAEEDLWANPAGSKVLVEKAREVWTLFGKGENITYTIRPGVHELRLEDFKAYLDWLNWK